MRLISTFCLMLAFVLAGSAHAHIGEKVFLIFEIPDADLGDIDLFDGDISDWEDVVGDASLTPEDFFADPTVGDGAQYNPADMDYRVWLGWNNTGSTSRPSAPTMCTSTSTLAASPPRCGSTIRSSSWWMATTPVASTISATTRP